MISVRRILRMINTTNSPFKVFYDDMYPVTEKKCYISLPEYNNGYGHYTWESRVFGYKNIWDDSAKPDLPRKLFPLLCESFGVPTPTVLCLGIPLVTGSRGASTRCVRRVVIFHNSFSFYSVIHEFIHWYFWCKYKNYITHNLPYAKKFQRRLVWVVRRYL